MDLPAVREEAARVALIVYIAPCDTFDGLRSMKIRALEEEAENRGYQFNTLIVLPDVADAGLLKQGCHGADLASKDARFNCSLKDVRTVWFAGSGTCQFARDIFWYMYTNHRILEYRMERGSQLRRLLKLYRAARDRELHRSERQEPTFSGLWSG